MISIQVDNIEGVFLSFEKLQKKLGAKVLVKALKYGAMPVKKVMKQKAPVSDKNAFMTLHRHAKAGKLTVKGVLHKPGELKRSITVKANSKYPPAVWIGPNRTSGSDAYYHRWVEMGTRYHGGNPYIRNTFDETKEIAIKRINEYLREIVLSMKKI